MTAWILLRGLTREASHWGGFPERLRLALRAGDEGDTVTLIDLPGNGQTLGMRAPLDVAGMTDFVRARAAQLRLAPPYRVLAMSLGGMVATDWAQRHPEEIVRLVLINTSMRPFCAMYERLRPAAWPALVRIAQHWRAPERCEALVHELTCNRHDNRADDIATWAEIRRTRGAGAANGLRQLWAAARFRAGRDAPRCPTLLLSSAADHLVNPVCSARIAAEWLTAHVEHPWAGHDLPHDDPEWTSKTLIDWCREDGG